ncbi:hypothetical protein [Bradyrhizobium sp. CB3481]|uniref:hypothetical protein n=1 Tax=Bradyrhizobium sp. CB3481 TaxID=3039158 RepID=UPI0024B083CE|nr:hypothetical protein [Bradyrhizobium sp. CB3481]WFU19215.1 hypothetical protein QA643_13110 [Bradyrhizobium sp. CB3481]
MAAMDVNGGMMRVADVGPGNGGRERKHDQDDRSSQHAHNSLLQHHSPMAPQARTRYRRGTGNSIPQCGGTDMVTARVILLRIAASVSQFRLPRSLSKTCLAVSPMMCPVASSPLIIEDMKPWACFSVT